MIREGWLDSHKVDTLDANAERFFLRLLLKADDYGRFHATPQILRSLLFPMKEDVRATDMSRCLSACEAAGLIRCYEDSGRKYLEIQRFDQRLRTKASKFPEPADYCPTNDGHMPGIGRLEEKRREEEVEEKRKPTALQIRIGGFLNRRETTAWSKKEVAALKEIGTPLEEDLQMLEEFYLAEIPKERDYRRTSLMTLLNNWNGEMDKARFFRLESK